MEGYPVLVNLGGKSCLVVGGGRVAARKAVSLAQAGARVLVVSPAVTPGLLSMAETGVVSLRRRPYEPADLEGVFLVFAAADRRVNERVAAEARALGKPVNVADDPALCDFFVPAVLRRGPLTVAVSTGGASPALAARIRDHLAAFFPAGWGPFLEFLGEVRERLCREVGDPLKRRSLLEEMAGPLVWEKLDQGDFAAAKERVDLVYRGGGG